MTTNPQRYPPARSRSWDGVADWYAGWAGPTGSRHHKRLAIPLMLELLGLEPGERLLDLGCGPGPLAPAALAAGASLTGVDLSEKLIAIARRHHPGARFEVGDATRLKALPVLRPESFDAASFLLSIQDIAPLDTALGGAAWALKPGGRLGIVMLHPCFRVPRQSGWGTDPGRALTYRRLDSYLSELAVPMQPHDGGVTRSYHRPLQTYVGALAAAGFAVAGLREIGAFAPPGRESRADRRARAEFPLLLGLSARKG